MNDVEFLHTNMTSVKVCSSLDEGSALLKVAEDPIFRRFEVRRSGQASCACAEHPDRNHFVFVF